MLRPARWRGVWFEGEADRGRDRLRAKTRAPKFRRGGSPKRKGADGMGVVLDDEAQFSDLIRYLFRRAAQQPAPVVLGGNGLLVLIPQLQRLVVAISAFKQKLHHLTGTRLETQIQKFS